MVLQKNKNKNKTSDIEPIIVESRNREKSS